MRSSNPVLGRIGSAQSTYSVPGGPVGGSVDYGYQGGPVQTGVRDVMTVDDVVVKTISLVGVTALFAAITWAIVPATSLYPVWIGAALVGFVIGMIISFAQITNPIILMAYAVIQGVFLGAVSKAYNDRWPGIVVSAVIATLGVFAIMAALYKFRIIRATPKFMKVMFGIVAGLVVVGIVNFIWFLVSGEASPLRNGGPLAIGFSLVCIVVAALMFVVSFQQIEDGVRAGLPRKYGWLGAFGLLVELIWMYLEFLRLLSYFSDD